MAGYGVRMPWSIDDLHATSTPQLPRACGASYYEWRRAIRDRGLHPKTAAEELAGADFEYYDQGETRGTIRLSVGHRVFFSVDQKAEIVTVNKVGTHLQPRGW